MYAIILEGTNKVQSFVDDSIAKMNPGHPLFVEVLGGINVELGGASIDGAYKYAIEKGIVQERDYTQDEAYIDRQIEKEKQKQIEILALKNVKKVLPDLAAKIDKKIEALS